MSQSDPVDLTRLARTTDGDAAVLAELLRIFIEQADEKMASLNRSLANSNFEQIGEEAHSIKGASANIGADRLREIASSLEAAARSSELQRISTLVAEVLAEYRRVRGFIEGRP